MNHATAIAPPVQEDAVMRSAIDRSCRGPVLFFFASAVPWLLFATLGGWVLSLKLVWPEFLTGLPGWDWAVLNYGRLRPAVFDALLYGWAFNAAFGIAVWLTARLCRRPLRRAGGLLAGGILWNLGVTVGTVSVLVGWGTGVAWLDYPVQAGLLMAAGYAVVAIRALDMFRNRRPGHIYISLWFLLGALFWFPWLFGTANVLLVWSPAPGPVQPIIHGWYMQGLAWLWLVSVGLAAVYYFIPKVTGRPLHSYALSSFGFWSLAVIVPWTAGSRYIGGPLPAWMITVGIAASFLLLIPVVVTGINHHLSLRGQFELLPRSPALAFSVAGAMGFTLWGLHGSLLVFRSWNTVVGFTVYSLGQDFLLLYGFFTFAACGAAYYILPRLTGRDWASARLVRWHFVGSIYGTAILVVMVLITGIASGGMIADGDTPQNTFPNVLTAVHPYLVAANLGWLLLVAGQLAFAVQVARCLGEAGWASGPVGAFLGRKTTGGGGS